MKDVNVILTCAGGLESVGKIESLKSVKERNVTVIGTDMVPGTPGSYIADKFYTVPSGNSSEYIDSMLKIAEKENVDVILPASQNEILSLSKNKALFEDTGTIIACSDHVSIKTASDKGLLYEFLKKNNLPFPNFFNISSLDQFKQSIHRLGYPNKPVVMKPRVSSGSRGFRIIKDDIDEKDFMLSQKPANNIYIKLCDIERVFQDGEFPNLVLSEYLPGKEYSTDVLAKNGDALIIVPRIRDRTMHGISIVGTVEKNSEIEKIVKLIVKAFNFNYNVNIQLKGSENGNLIPYEINPRISGTIAAATGAGANLIYYGVKLALKEEIPKVNIKYGTKMIRYWKEMYKRSKS